MDRSTHLYEVIIPYYSETFLKSLEIISIPFLFDKIQKNGECHTCKKRQIGMTLLMLTGFRQKMGSRDVDEDPCYKSQKEPP